MLSVVAVALIRLKVEVVEIKSPPDRVRSPVIAAFPAGVIVRRLVPVSEIKKLPSVAPSVSITPNSYCLAVVHSEARQTKFRVEGPRYKSRNLFVADPKS